MGDRGSRAEAQNTDLVPELKVQQSLYTPGATRSSILAAPTLDSDRVVTVNVWRNHGFEPLVPVIERYAQFGGWRPSFVIGDYDDSMSFANHQPADIELIWIDPTRYADRLTEVDLWSWLRSRLDHLRTLSDAHVVVATWSQDATAGDGVFESLDSIPGVAIADLSRVCSDANVDLLDLRTSKITGSPIGRRAQLVIAQALGCRWLAAFVVRTVKVVAFDLDYTLHGGALVDDGIHGIHVSDGYESLQLLARRLRERGTFVALVSRNEREDVVELLSQPSYPLAVNDFDVVWTGFGPKSQGLTQIANELNIGVDSVLFVDDNVGELAAAVTDLPEIRIVWAQTDPLETLAAVENFPGVWQWSVNEARVSDAAANVERRKIEDASADARQYLASIGAQLDFQLDAIKELPRLADLSQRTNQFNLTLRRLSEQQLNGLMRGEDSSVISVGLSDRLSDSGTIGLIATSYRDGQLHVEELCVSCRAMGRQLEDAIVIGALSRVPQISKSEHVVFDVADGPRNGPVRVWLSRLLGLDDAAAPGEYRISAEQIQRYGDPDGVICTFS